MERRWAVLILLLFALPTQAAVEMYYLHNDHLGTPRVVTNQAQQVVWKGQLKPFGETKVEVEAITNHRRFPGQRFDIESRLYYNYFRDYDPTTGRYVQSDPIGLRGGLNTYAYVYNNPTRWVDVLGLWSPGAHDQILYSAFGDRLSSNDVRRLQESSRDFDRRTQSSDQSYMHSLARKGQSTQDAIRMRDQFVDDTLDAARSLAKAGNGNAALDKLGEACHPIMDSSSPMHTDPFGNPRTWNPLWPFGHSPNDSIGNETVNHLTPAILEQQRSRLNKAYDRVFGAR
jgi:RHS repeat-associated protein